MGGTHILPILGGVGTQILPILGGRCPDFTSKNQKACTPLPVMFSEWSLKRYEQQENKSAFKSTDMGLSM